MCDDHTSSLQADILNIYNSCRQWRSNRKGLEGIPEMHEDMESFYQKYLSLYSASPESQKCSLLILDTKSNILLQNLYFYFETNIGTAIEKLLVSDQNINVLF